MIRSIVIGPPPRDSHLAAYPAGLRRVTGSGTISLLLCPSVIMVLRSAPRARKIRNPGQKKFMVAER